MCRNATRPGVEAPPRRVGCSLIRDPLRIQRSEERPARLVAGSGIYAGVMSENLRIYTKAIYGLDHVVRLVGDEAWDNQSPCPEWTARDVIGHVIGIQRWLEATARGITPPRHDLFDNPGTTAGDDPGGAWAAVRDDVLEALDGQGALQVSVEAFRGPETLDSQVGWNVVDTVGHTWDLARAAGVDDRLDPDVVHHALGEAAPMIEKLRRPKMFGESVTTSNNADEQEQLLAMYGRSID